MKKRYKMKNLDCANCAAKIEERIKRIPGVADASVSFTLQRLTLDAPEEKLEQLLPEVLKIVKAIEPDCSVTL
ncbi:MAG: cation transporter [Victivallales bacterium]|nr:cation transporter [Victivallales bacterium]